MYIALLGALVATGLWLGRSANASRVLAGRLLLAITVLFFGSMSLWVEALWFESLGYESRFWTVVFARAATALAGALVGGGIMFLLTRPETSWPSRAPRWPAVLGAIMGALWGFTQWDVVLRYVHRVPMGVSEPILGHDAGFYLFVLPLYLSIRALLIALAVLAVCVALVRLMYPRLRRMKTQIYTWRYEPHFFHEHREEARARTLLYVPAGFLLLVMAWSFFLARYQLMNSQFGAVYGPGWTDVHVRLPVYWALAVLSLALGLLVLAPATRARLHAYNRRPWRGLLNTEALATATPVAAVMIAAGGGLWMTPAFFQWVHVQPNEITLERPYLEHEIAFTRLGFRLHEAEDRQFPALENLPPEAVAANHELLSEVRLWDDRVLQDVFQQFQAIRLYYQFHHVDVDRYRIGDRLRLVMVSAREMAQSALPAPNQTFVNTRFKFTHGNGITLAPVSEFTAHGLPNLLVHGIPPIAERPELRVERPEIYYGMLTDSHVFARTSEAEFDYPSGAENVYSHYAGTGGIELRNAWRKFVIGWRLDGTRFLLSRYPTPDTRVKYRRQVLDRVKAIAPFLTVNRDPYIVASEGRLYWLIEGYTSSEHFPYSQRYDAMEPTDYSDGTGTRTRRSQTTAEFAGANYIRNSVKIAVDAYTGSVDFYVFEPDDPIVRAWARIFPDLFKPADTMPADLRAHVRYPHEFLLLQGLVNARYHMEDPVVFYNQEDLWMRATERYYEGVQPVEPYYIMWTPPEAEEPEFVAMLPFTPKGRQVLIGWMAGLSDGDNYGRLITYKFPKDKRVLGPQQVDTKIDQDPALKAQLTLWDQRGSRVIRGNVLAIPIGDTLMYVEPIFIEAGTAAYPELRVVAIMHGDQLSYADTFERALVNLVDPNRTEQTVAMGAGPVGAGMTDLAREANDAFEQYLELQGERRFAEAAEQLNRLQRALRDLDTERVVMPRSE
jgi:uncharacterized membrane protein (UPF0182 family)